MHPKQMLNAAQEKVSAAVDTVRQTASTIRNSAPPAAAQIRSTIGDALRSTATTVAVGSALLVQSVTAQPEGCTPPGDLQPVFNLLESITQVTMMGGLTIAALGIAIGGILFMWPGQDQSRRAKQTITYTIMGTVIILSAHAVVAYVTSQMGAGVC